MTLSKYAIQETPHMPRYAKSESYIFLNFLLLLSPFHFLNQNHPD